MAKIPKTAPDHQLELVAKRNADLERQHVHDSARIRDLCKYCDELRDAIRAHVVDGVGIEYVEAAIEEWERCRSSE